ncbi:basic amino acid ABC transporter substrate-binding protein [Bacillus sp. PS06]|uniref:basic amino acid ABC transporter substrate-binding protein n=1 Tax=Bacillus sp. PS06 TaxID=2764176 RepID=UPI00177F4B28|nr:basic amino acid ABC transporter substrate-binding protein [Bacillus sp. PS06]MBD8067773.1 basic amino acid ABC transporter substrate-binding protein [Bacillus sp. PS06]
MKKTILVALTTMLIFVLAACGNSSKSSGEEDGGKVLKVATDAAYAPFEYLEGDKIVGFDVDIVNAVADEAGYEINIVNVGWDPMLIEVEQGTADIGVSAITINDKRKETYDFTSPYFLSNNKILVKEGSNIQSADDLEGVIVAVQNATTGALAVEGLLGENSPNIKKFDNNNLAIMELINGGAEAVVADDTVIEAYVENNPDQGLVVIEDADYFEPEFYGFMFPKGSEYRDDFDAALKTIIENGTYAKIYEEWFGNEPNVDVLK